MFNNLYEFYRSREWQQFRDIVIADRIHDDGFVYDEVTEKPIVKAYDIILHHKIELTEENVFDYNISLNPENIMIVSHRTHNYIHDKFGYSHRQVFLIYGAPLSGKSKWIRENMCEGDLVINIDDIWECVSGQKRYHKPNRLKAVVFKVRDTLIESAKYRQGKWNNCFISGGYPLQSERERLCKELGAREVFIDIPKEECLARLELCDCIEDKDEFKKYIDEWFERFTHA